jgi:tRNA dimethylallyltransferase
VPDDAPAWNASGYGTVRALVHGTIGQGEAMERVVTETRQYAKRQRTWFRHQLDGEEVTRIDVHQPGSGEVLERWFAGVAP